MRQAAKSTTDSGIKTNYELQVRIVNGAMDDVANPFTVSNLSIVTYSWCTQDNDGIDNSLRDAQRHIESQSHIMRSLALEYAVTQKAAYATKALSLMKAWAARHTPINLYSFNIDFRNTRFDGITDGHCSRRPWNFALDAMWQTYGLINVSDAYLLLTRNGFKLSDADNNTLRTWIRKMAQAVNSSHHAWTKWADTHPTSAALERYRLDNHLSWSNLGLLAAGVALNDTVLINYVLEGTAWNDLRSPSYANPSPILKLIDGAIESSGRVYEERINRSPPINYSFFHLQAMTLIARIDEVLGRNRVRTYKGRDGAGLREAFLRYQPYIMGTPKAGGEGNMVHRAWLYYFAQRWWPTVTAFKSAAARTPTDRTIVQTGGPVVFLFKRLGG